MKVVGNYCEKIETLLDSYLNNELLVETIHEVLKHIQECFNCLEALRVRQRVRAILQTAVRRETAPLALRQRIRRSIRCKNK